MNKFRNAIVAATLMLFGLGYVGVAAQGYVYGYMEGWPCSDVAWYMPFQHYCTPMETGRYFEPGPNGNVWGEWICDGLDNQYNQVRYEGFCDSGWVYVNPCPDPTQPCDA